MFERPGHCTSIGMFTGVLLIVPVQEFGLSEDQKLLRLLQLVMWNIANAWKGNLRIKIGLTKHVAED